MKQKNIWITIGLLAGFLISTVGMAIPSAQEEDRGDDATQQEVAETEEESAPAASSQKPVLDGAQVYAWNCGSCHSERYPKERTDAEWDVIMTHMRVRANMTAEQTRAVLLYLKENNE